MTKQDHLPLMDSEAKRFFCPQDKIPRSQTQYQHELLIQIVSLKLKAIDPGTYHPTQDQLQID